MAKIMNSNQLERFIENVLLQRCRPNNEKAPIDNPILMEEIQGDSIRLQETPHGSLLYLTGSSYADFVLRINHLSVDIWRGDYGNFDDYGGISIGRGVIGAYSIIPDPYEIKYKFEEELIRIEKKLLLPKFEYKDNSMVRVPKEAEPQDIEDIHIKLGA